MTTVGPPPPLVAILVLAWNGRDDTLRCLESLKRLSHTRALVAVIDNASRDDSVAAVRAAAPSVTILENPRNLGFAEGNNRGIRWALDQGADYVVLLNNDVVVDPDFLKPLISACGGDPRLGIVGPKVLELDDPEAPQKTGGWVKPHSYRIEFLDWRRSTGDAPILVDYVAGCALLARRDTLLAIGLLEPRFFILWEETDLCARAREGGWRCAVVPASRIWHRGSVTFGGVLSPRYAYYYFRNLLLYMSRRSPAPGLRAYFRALRSQWDFLSTLQRRGRAPGWPTTVAASLGILHYVVGRFGEAPAVINRLNRLANKARDSSPE